MKGDYKMDKCMICGSQGRYYFSKNYSADNYSRALDAHYHKCSNCNFVYSVTHQLMPFSDWEELNSDWHNGYENDFSSRISNQPPYPQMALAMQILSEHKVINPSKAIDFAAGYGTLAKVLGKYFSFPIKCHDPFVQDPVVSDQYVASVDLEVYQLVINSAMFEHVQTRNDLDRVNELVDEHGVLMLHTVVCENVPLDPDWFYLTPIVHCAFHTNKSMNLLMAQWNYAASIYCPSAKSWFLFKKGAPILDELHLIVERINAELQCEYFIYKKGFVDYWKGF